MITNFQRGEIIALRAMVEADLAADDNTTPEMWNHFHKLTDQMRRLYNGEPIDPRLHFILLGVWPLTATCPHCDRERIYVPLTDHRNCSGCGLLICDSCLDDCDGQGNLKR